MTCIWRENIHGNMTADVIVRVASSFPRVSLESDKCTIRETISVQEQNIGAYFWSPRGLWFFNTNGTVPSKYIPQPLAQGLVSLIVPFLYASTACEARVWSSNGLYFGENHGETKIKLAGTQFGQKFGDIYISDLANCKYKRNCGIYPGEDRYL